MTWLVTLVFFLWCVLDTVHLWFREKIKRAFFQQDLCCLFLDPEDPDAPTSDPHKNLSSLGILRYILVYFPYVISTFLMASIYRMSAGNTHHYVQISPIHLVAWIYNLHQNRKTLVTEHEYFCHKPELLCKNQRITKVIAALMEEIKMLEPHLITVHTKVDKKSRKLADELANIYRDMFSGLLIYQFWEIWDDV